MSPHSTHPVLIIGGSGIVGALASKALRRLQPDLPIAIGGRDLAKAEAVAREVGLAQAARVDLGRADLGQPEETAYSAVALFVKDETLNGLKYAQARGLPHLSLSDGTFEIGPTVAHYIHRPASAPILMASHWLAGAATLPILHFAREFRRLETIKIDALLGEEDMGGPAAFADYQRITTATPSALTLTDGRFLWVNTTEAARPITSVDGVQLPAHPYSPLDIVSLAAATDARSIRLDFALGESASRRRGEPFSTEILIELTGELPSGERAHARYEIVHPAGQAPLTALCAAVALERLLGRAGGAPVPPGLYLPEVLIDPAYMVAKLEAFGAQIRRV